MNTLFTQSLDIRVAYAKAEIYGDEITQYEAEIEAHILGADAYRAGQPIVTRAVQNRSCAQSSLGRRSERGH